MSEPELAAHELMQLDAMIVEYFHYHNFMETAQCFRREADAQRAHASASNTHLHSPKSSQNPHASPTRLSPLRTSGPDIVARASATFSLRNSRTKIMTQMLDAFDSGCSSTFFAHWRRFVLSQDSRHSNGADRLGFYVRVFFAVYPIHPNYAAQFETGKDRAERLAQNMREFKEFIETWGSELAQDAEFLPFYALPYVPDATLHPSFQEQFDPEWPVQLREQLHSFLFEVLDSFSSPTLHRLFRVAIDSDRTLVKAVQTAASVHGIDKPKRSKKRSKKRKTEDRLQEKLRSLKAQRPPPPPEPTSDAEVELVHDDLEPIPEPEPHVQPQPDHQPPPADQILVLPLLTILDLAPLDYTRVRTDLSDLPNHNRALLLQALRYRLNCVRGVDRLSLLQEYIDNDLLELAPAQGLIDAAGGNTDASLRASVNANNRLPGALFASFFRSREDFIRESAARLVNTMVTYSRGRRYVLSHNASLGVLVQTLRREDGDTPARQHVLGALQQFSLRRHAQTTMISLDLIDWIITTLRDPTNLSLYTVEYATALLMNLSLRVAAKLRIEQSAVEVLAVLTNLLDKSSGEVSTYVNGTLYSILSRQAVRSRAFQMGLEGMIDELLAKQARHAQELGYTDEQLVRQLEYIRGQLYSDAPDEPLNLDDDSDAPAGSGFEDEGDSVAVHEMDLQAALDSEVFVEEDSAAAGGFVADELASIPRLRQMPRGEELLCADYVRGGSRTAVSPSRRAVRGGKPPRFHQVYPSRPNSQLRSHSSASYRSDGKPFSHRPTTPRWRIQNHPPRPKADPVPDTKAIPPPRVKDGEVDAEMEKEYYDAFSTRAKVPRTPHGLD